MPMPSLLRKRQALVLLMAYAVGKKPIYGRTRYQKLIFLADKELETDWYTFYPHHYGPFSKDLYEDLEDLIQVGFVEEKPEKNNNGLIHYKYTLTREGEAVVWDVLKYPMRHAMGSRESVEKLLRKIENIKRNYCFKNLDTLLGIIYAKHLEYARRSVLV